ncbi:head GIN domain-containing protein [Rufibacter glacialis]|uniref:Head GIN domain-containing protein n=1 Tax=Rufibacter glacialis TaxID=1259555 RepID=A0ABV4RF62_9BACT|nr:head GIN domain-containing protein [Rufibacter glacialis]GGK81822.1 DUF2807 domain-containing protein [Rufibacter glacialis]
MASCDILGSGPCLQGKGATKKEARDVSPFKGIDLRVQGNVVVSAGSKTEVSLEGFGNLLPEITTEVMGSTLVIRSASCLEYDNEDVTIYVSLPDLDHIELKSAGTVRVQAVPSSQKLRLSVSGSGTLRYSGSANRISLLQTGSGEIELTGTAHYLESISSGSGKISGYFLQTDTAKAISTGSGHQHIWVTKVLDATVSGSGNIYYRGHPSSLTTYSSGSGKILNDN